VPIFLLDDKRFVRAEVQLRTINMNSWAKLEHRMIYKKNLSEEILSLTRDELQECAEMSHQLDMKMQAIRNIVEK
jgi:putative GTP pyrophosphokinase